METSESASDEDEAKYYSKIYYVDNVTVENADDATKISKSVDERTKRAIAKRYWSTPPSQNADSSKTVQPSKTSKSETVPHFQNAFSKILKSEPITPPRKGVPLLKTTKTEPISPHLNGVSSSDSQSAKNVKTESLPPLHCNSLKIVKPEVPPPQNVASLSDPCKAKPPNNPKPGLLPHPKNNGSLANSHASKPALLPKPQKIKPPSNNSKPGLLPHPQNVRAFSHAQKPNGPNPRLFPFPSNIGPPLDPYRGGLLPTPWEASRMSNPRMLNDMLNHPFPPPMYAYNNTDVYSAAYWFEMLRPMISPNMTKKEIKNFFVTQYFNSNRNGPSPYKLIKEFIHLVNISRGNNFRRPQSQPRFSDILTQPNIQVKTKNTKNKNSTTAKPNKEIEINKNEQKSINNLPVVKEGVDLASENKTKPHVTNNSKPSEIIHLESSDDESVVEVDIPLSDPQPAICIDSSDDETNSAKTNTTHKELSSTNNVTKPKSTEKKRSISPVLSVVSSNSDDFIQNDCANLNISTNKNYEFNFQMHGPDFTDEIPDSVDKVGDLHNKSADDCILLSENESPSKSQDDLPVKDTQMFATPKSTKKKVPKSAEKSYVVSKDDNVPFVDVYESESSDFPESVIDVPINPTPLRINKIQTPKNISKRSFAEIIDDTLVMANVVGVETRDDVSSDDDLVIDIDTDDKSGNCVSNDIESPIEKKSIEECIVEMDKFYNHSWGGENFDHSKIQKELPSSKSFWTIDPSDKYPSQNKKKDLCLICHKSGHREDKCFNKTSTCYMCGVTGHSRAKCPSTVCLNCGSKTKVFQLKCLTCRRWNGIKCSICNQHGHPQHSCPDLWRRYHLTLKNEIPLIEDKSKKPITTNMYCSGCAKKGHIVSNCKNPNLQYYPSISTICKYTPVYVPDGVRNKENISTDIQDLTKHDHGSNSSKKRRGSIIEHTPSKKMKIDKNSSETVTFENISSISFIFLDGKQLDKITSPEGSVFFSCLALKNKVVYKIHNSVFGPMVFIVGNHNNQKLFKEEFNEQFPSPEHSQSLSKHKLTKDLSNDLNSLNSFIGDPIKLHNSLVNVQKHLLKLKSKNILTKKISLVTKSVDEICKKLNMILIGQAGFCNGKEYVSKLREEIDKLRQSPVEDISVETKMSLSKWYFYIFSPLSRKNFVEMVQQFRQQLHTFPKWLKSQIKLKKKASNQVDPSKKQGVQIEKFKKNMNR